MQLGGFLCPTQTVTKSITASYGSVINDVLIALIALTNSAFSSRAGPSWRILPLFIDGSIGV
jgi:hypothetical protein